MTINKNFKKIVLVVGFLILTILYFELSISIIGFEPSNSITLYAVFITIFSTLYSNYKSDKRVNKQIETSEYQFKKQLKQNEKNLKEQLLFNKKQEIYLNLYSQLNEFWQYLDDERKNYYFEIHQEPIEVYISYETFSKIYEIIYLTKNSPEFNYMSNEIQEIINTFIKFVDINLEHNEYYQRENDADYWNSFEILSKLYPILKLEIGLHNDKFLIN